ncbi:MAG TPA: 4-alpha-glucanotransferase [Gemmatimonadaceae bacterium]|nr:4-alpha-glucanotransferase [Gemmatimonadaceae bacterium]
MRGAGRAAPRPRLRALAARLGIVPEYLDQTGTRLVRTSDVTREVLLSVMGFDAPTEDAARGWLAELDHEDAGAVVEPVRVVERDAAAARTIGVRVPRELGTAKVVAMVTEESGRTWRLEKRIRGNGTLRLSSLLPYGYHTVSLLLSNGVREIGGEQSLIVVPSRCVTPDALLGDDRVFGLVANLYAVRREQDWGIGDFTTLTALAEWGAGRGAEFVGVNPLHALFNRGTDVGPYSPVSRLFRNHIYIDVAAVPVLARSAEGRALVEASEREAAALRAKPLVDYDGVIALKERALREAHRLFREHASSQERKAFDAFVSAREPELTHYATWMAIAAGDGIPDWRQWPAPMRDAASGAVSSFREANDDRVDFHRWLQFETHRQLGDAAARGQALGMRIGIYQDLAIGTNPGGSDTWSFPDLFLSGAAVGAPPDPYSSIGQNWGLPPMSPRALRAQGYRYWIQLLRRAFEHAGALRIDHVMGLFRTFWIPDGGTGRDGAYVRFPADDLLGILALESVRHDALVVGEDLGTVPSYVPPAMKKWGLLSSKVMLFEQERGGFKRASRYPELALATANTHDMAPLAGFWAGRDVELRAAAGLVGDASEVDAARKDRERERRALLDRVQLDEPRPGDAAFTRSLVGAVHEFVSSTRSRLVGFSYDDVVGESEPVNVPGVGPEGYPSWRRRNRITLEEVSWSDDADAVIRCGDRRREKP